MLQIPEMAVEGKGFHEAVANFERDRLLIVRSIFRKSAEHTTTDVIRVLLGAQDYVSPVCAVETYV